MAGPGKAWQGLARPGAGSCQSPLSERWAAGLNDGGAKPNVLTPGQTIQGLACESRESGDGSEVPGDGVSHASADGERARLHVLGNGKGMQKGMPEHGADPIHILRRRIQAPPVPLLIPRQ